MISSKLSHFDIIAAKKHFIEGKNVTEILRIQKNVKFNTPEIIETAYDLQAGAYIKHVESNPEQALLYAAELASIIDKHTKPSDSLLDIGTGELTTLSFLVNSMANKPRCTYAFDISWSRLYKGLVFAKKNLPTYFNKLYSFVSDIGEIPLLDKSIDITTSSHALEPNGGRLEELMLELFRVTKNKIIIFEPCFEINNEEGKKRMELLGYIKNVDGVVEDLGGRVVEKIIIKNISNPLNPTVCFVIKPPPIFENKNNMSQHEVSESIFSVPGTSYPLVIIDNFYYSIDTGLCFPILKNIPILKSNAAVLASSLS